MEAKYLEKKGAYDQAKSSMDSDTQKVLGEVRQLEVEVLEAEQQYHELNMAIVTTEGKLQRTQKESRCLRNEDQAAQQQLRRRQRQRQQQRKQKRQGYLNRGDRQFLGQGFQALGRF